VLEKTSSQECRVEGFDAFRSVHKKDADESTANLPLSAVTDQQNVAPAEDKFTKYRKMQKMLPERAVRQKMQGDVSMKKRFKPSWMGVLFAAVPQRTKEKTAQTRTP
jgi:hypothetical protein